MPRTLRKNNNKKVPAKLRRSKRRFGKTFRNRKQNEGFCFIPLTEYGLKRNSTDQATMDNYLSDKQRQCNNFSVDFNRIYNDKNFKQTHPKTHEFMTNYPKYKPPVDTESSSGN